MNRTPRRSAAAVDFLWSRVWLDSAWPAVLVWISGASVALLLGWQGEAAALSVLALTLAFAGLLAVWRRRSLAVAAIILDEQLGARNRLEMVAALAHSDSPLAIAQREEAAVSLDLAARVRPPILALSAMVVAAFLLLANGIFMARWIGGALPRGASASLASSSVPAGADGRIDWRSPESEIKATKIEEVPLEAVAESGTGFEKVTLLASVNGAPPVAFEFFQDPLSPGKHPLGASIYLDELNVEAFDIVAYHLTGNLQGNGPSAPVLSPLQFIQVRPFREDVWRQAGGKMGECHQILTKIKVAQLGLMKDNFVLAGNALPKSHPLWQQENGFVARQQGVLAAKVGELFEMLVKEAASSEMVHLISLARPAMIEAASKMESQANAEASGPQGQALAHIVECEKFFIKAINSGKESSPSSQEPKANDPFADRQKYELPPREFTEAGQLEALAKKQAELLKEITGSSAETGRREKNAERAQRQDDVAGSSQRLGEESQLPAAARQALRQAASAGQEASNQLKANDPGAASEPAARALHHLRQASAETESEGRRRASRQLANAQTRLNQLQGSMPGPNENPNQPGAGSGNEPGHSAETGNAALSRRLQEEAARQQGQGSAAAARSLQEFAQKVASADASPAELARDAAARRLALEQEIEAARLAATELATAWDHLQKAAQTERGIEVDRQDALAESSAELLAAAQLANAAARTGQASAHQAAIENSLRSPGPYAHRAALVRSLEEPVQGLLSILVSLARQSRRQESFSLIQQDQAPARYRPATAAYSERLSQ
jgi:hypothetical protein